MSPLPPAVLNHGLFSDHYLTNRLPQDAGWVRSDIQTSLGALRKLYGSSTTDAPQLMEAGVEDRVFRPVLRNLGFSYDVQQQAPGERRFPDYALFASDAQRSLALAAKGDERATGYFAHAVGIAEAKQWGVDLDKFAKDPRDGNPSFQLWLYLQQTDRKWGILSNGRKWRLFSKERYFDSYLEIDLLEAVESADEVGIRLFLTLFGIGAFTDGVGGQSLLSRVLAGSVEYSLGVGESLQGNVYRALRLIAQGFASRVENGYSIHSEDDLSLIQQNSMRLLYRLLFVFHAEGRGLFTDPRYFRSGYSLHELKKEIASRLDNNAPLLESGTDYWTRLKELFRLIDKGSNTADAGGLSIPPYNGGLFDPDRNPFLENRAIGNRSLAHAIDLLARTNYAGESGFVDYSSLSVQHLGTIYEGLLEFKLRPSQVRMVAVGPDLIWTSYDDWVAHQRRPVAFDQFEADLRVQAGEVYLSNRSSARRSSGSYFTPDSIVKFIVEEAIDPIVDGRLKAAEASGASMAQSVLDIRVIDPAMGSGHFLVEAVDLLSARLLDAIQRDASAGRPVPVLLENLTLAWAKREVATRCVYGVDLSELAVELAKLSLWLDTASNDKPLSFFDHHLRCGNSLVGAKIVDLGWLPGERPPGARQQLDRPFGLMEKLSTRLSELMDLPEETASDSKRKAQLFDRLLQSDEYRRIRLLCDLHSALRFIDPGLWPSERAYQEVVNEAYFGDSEKWIQKTSKEWVLRGREIASRERFINWELEFPEAYFSADSPAANPGFDAVIGNPPYISMSTQATDTESLAMRPVLRGLWPRSAAGKFDIYSVFVDLSVALTRKGGRHSFIVENSFFRAAFGRRMRGFLADRTTIETIIDFKDFPVFSGVGVQTTVYVLSRSEPSEDSMIDYFEPAVGSLHQPLANLRTLLSGGASFLHSQPEQSSLRGEPLWSLGPSPGRFLFRGLRLEDLASVIAKGVWTGDKGIFVEPQVFFSDPSARESPMVRPVLDGSDVFRYTPPSSTRRMIYPQEGRSGETTTPLTDPVIASYFESHREALLGRRIWGKRVAELELPYYAILNPQKGDREVRLVSRDQIHDRCEFALDEGSANVYLDTCVSVILKPEFEGARYYLLAVLNSTAAYDYLKASCPVVFGRTVDLRTSALKRMRVPFDRDWVTRLTPQSDGTVSRVTASETADEIVSLGGAAPDSQAAVSAQCAKRICELSSARVSEIQGFLTWFEAAVGSSIESWVGKTTLKEYYVHSLADVVEVLRQNEVRSKIRPHRNRPDFETLEAAFERSTILVKTLEKKISVLEVAVERLVSEIMKGMSVPVPPISSELMSGDIL